MGSRRSISAVQPSMRRSMSSPKQLSASSARTAPASATNKSSPATTQKLRFIASLSVRDTSKPEEVNTQQRRPPASPVARRQSLAKCGYNQHPAAFVAPAAAQQAPARAPAWPRRLLEVLGKLQPLTLVVGGDALDP